MSPELSSKLSRIRLVAFDVDGTLTDGRITYFGEEELQSFSVHDGYGIVRLVKAGVKVVWITARGCRATVRRAHELGIHELVRKSGKKTAVLRRIQGELGVTEAETLSMGDDISDLALADASGVFVCPADARPEVIERADFVCVANGGFGAARELADMLLAARGERTKS